MCVYVVSFGWTDLPPKTSRATSASSPSIQKFGQQGAPAHERPSPPPPGTGRRRPTAHHHVTLLEVGSRPASRGPSPFWRRGSRPASLVRPTPRGGTRGESRVVWTTTWGQTSAEGPPPADDHLEQRRLRTAVPTARAHEGRRWQAGRSGDNFAKVFTAHLSEHLRVEPGPMGRARLEASRRLEVYCFNRSNARPKRERSVAPSTAGTIGDGRPRTPRLIPPTAHALLAT